MGRGGDQEIRPWNSTKPHLPITESPDLPYTSCYLLLKHAEKSATCGFFGVAVGGVPSGYLLWPADPTKPTKPLTLRGEPCRMLYSRGTTMRKWNVLVTGNDGRPFYQNFHVIEEDPDAAMKWLMANFPYPKIRPTIKLQEIEEVEDASFFLPGIVYKSGKAYFNK
jgi:hypothetical protein